MTFKCPYCGEPSSEGMNTGYRGAGGIAIELTGLVCMDCHAAMTCAYCGEFEEELDEYGYCEYCGREERPEDRRFN